MRIFIVAGLLIAATTVTVEPAVAAGKASSQCTFNGLSAADRKRYQSRYHRRVRLDGQAFADDWLRKEACPTSAELNASKAKRADGKCTKTRTAMRTTAGFDGQMTMLPMVVCAN